MIRRFQRRVSCAALSAVALACVVGVSLQLQAAESSKELDGRKFPAHLLHATWQEFPLAGYTHPVTGVIYRGKPRPTCGMPLGGIDTGCIDIEPNGLLGYSTIFNHLVYPRLLYNMPFAGLSVDGKTWMLATDGKGKRYRPIEGGPGVFPHEDYTPCYDDIGLTDVNWAKSIDYFGHYPILDLEYDLDAPVAVGLRAWHPFVPGDAQTSMLPAVMFEFSLRNSTSQEKRGTIAFSFPGLAIEDDVEIQRKSLNDSESELHGVEVFTAEKGSPHELSYVLAAVGSESIRTGDALGVDGKAWNAIGRQLPQPAASSGTTLAVDFQLKPGESAVRRVVLAWHAPYWNAVGAPDSTPGKTFKHMYARRYASALDGAKHLVSGRQTLLKRVIAWQEEIYSDDQIPGWLADCLVNNLHLITEASVWGQSEGLLKQFRPESGLFALSECPRGCAQLECIPCSFYGNMPLVYFFPEAALSTLRGYKAYQFPDGRPPWIFGGETARDKNNRAPYDLTSPDAGYQSVLNGASYIVMADRLWQATGDKAVLEEFYDSLKRANEFALNLRPQYGLSQVMAMPEPGTDGGNGLGDTEWFEAPEPGWKGYVTHAGGVRMAQVQIMKRMAEAVGDDEYAKKCDQWLAAGSKVMEEKLWNGTYYLNFNDVDNDLKSDLIFGYQLDGEWICDAHGVPGVFPPDRIKTTLETIRKANCAISQTGATNYANPDGSPAIVGGYGTYGYFPPELMMLAMTYMYNDEHEFGVELLHRCMENIVCQWGYTWDAPNTIRGDMDTGQRHFGADYYQNMMLWFTPAAFSRQDIASSVEKGSLVQRVIEAGKQ